MQQLSFPFLKHLTAIVKPWAKESTIKFLKEETFPVNAKYNTQNMYRVSRRIALAGSVENVLR